MGIGRGLIGLALCLTAAACAHLLLPAAAQACRFWALIGDGYPEDMIAVHLRDGTAINLRELSWSNDNGWGIGSFPRDATPPLPLNRPLVRRGGPPAAHPTFLEYNVAVDELTLLQPKAAIAHVRNCTVSHCGVPDPHPFQRDGILFAHNGRMSDSLMVALLTADDPAYLTEHPPEYIDEYIDSELYFLYLLKTVRAHPEIGMAEALRLAVATLAPLTETRLNFVLTAGDTLFALRHAPNDANDPVRCYPAGPSPSPFWVVASQTLGSEPGNWPAIPERTLAVFVPGESPRFLAIDEAAETAEPDPDARMGDPARGRVMPNPGCSVVLLPIQIPARNAVTAHLEIWDVRGRLVWREGPIRLSPGSRQMSWDTRDLDGREVPSGTYYCRISVDEAIQRRRINVIR